MGPIDQPDWNEYTCAYLDQFAVYNELHDQRRRRCHGAGGTGCAEGKTGPVAAPKMVGMALSQRAATGVCAAIVPGGVNGTGGDCAGGVECVGHAFLQRMR